MTNHLKKVESCPKFPVKALLEVLYHHTFQRCVTPTAYIRCLEVWSILLESTQARYAPVALALAERVMQKVCFKFNAHVLKDLDTDALDENVTLENIPFSFHLHQTERFICHRMKQSGSTISAVTSSA